MRSYRFWMFHNDSWVKIKVKENEVLDIAFGGPDEEGFCWEEISFFVEDGRLFLEWDRQMQDCDGRYDISGESVCKIIDGKLDLKPCADPDNGPPGGMVPNWENVNMWQRDYSAEAAGY